jgi:acetyl esterase
MPATLIYDGQCPFCIKSAERLQRWAGPSRLEIIAMEDPGAMLHHPDLDYARTLAAVQLILSNGYLCEGAEAAANAAALKPGWRFLKIVYYLPLIRQFANLSYRVVARKRRRHCEGCQR